ncbi:hypothetical protein COBT_000911, partial [Conglomerata obtusa]
MLYRQAQILNVIALMVLDSRLAVIKEIYYKPLSDKDQNIANQILFTNNNKTNMKGMIYSNASDINMPQTEHKLSNYNNRSLNNDNEKYDTRNNYNINKNESQNLETDQEQVPIGQSATLNNSIYCYVGLLNDPKKMPKLNYISILKITPTIYTFCTKETIDELKTIKEFLYIENDTFYYGQGIQINPPQHITEMINYRNTVITNSFLDSIFMVYTPFKYIYNLFYSYYSYSYSGKNVVIYLLDSTVDEHHPDIKGRVVNLFDFSKLDKRKLGFGNEIIKTYQSDQNYNSYLLKHNLNEQQNEFFVNNKGKNFNHMRNSNLYRNMYTNINHNSTNYNELQPISNYLQSKFKNISEPLQSCFVTKKNYNTSLSCKNHGTAVATTIAGKKSGFAKDSKLIVMNVLDCDNKALLSTIIQALSLISQNDKKIILHLPISGPKSQILDFFINKLTQNGVIIVTAAGNASDLACDYSPGSAKNVINVGSLDKNSEISKFSNFGGCIRIYSLGEDIIFEGTSKNISMNGTSFSSAMIVGAVALYLEKNPLAELNDIWKYLVANADMSNSNFFVQKIPDVKKTRDFSTSSVAKSSYFGLY